MGEREVNMLKETVAQMTGAMPPQAQETLLQLQRLTQYLNHLEEGIVNMNSIIQVLGFEADYCRRSIQMVYRLLIDKGIATDEEIQERHMKEVAEPIEKAQKDVKEKVEAAVKQRQAQQSGIIDTGSMRDVSKED